MQTIMYPNGQMGVVVDVNSLLNLVPMGVQLWNLWTSKEAFKLPENWAQLDTDNKVDLIMAMLQEDRRRDNIVDLGNTAPQALRVLLGMLNGLGAGVGMGVAAAQLPAAAAPAAVPMAVPAAGTQPYALPAAGGYPAAPVMGYQPGVSTSAPPPAPVRR